MPQCPICQKKGILVFRRVKLRGKYNPTLKTRKRPNLQWFLVPKDAKGKWRKFGGQRIKVCTKCIKSFHKNRGVV